MHRFFIDPTAIDGKTAELTGQEAHHLASVLRLTKGEKIILFDGTGKVYTARIERVSKKNVPLSIVKAEEASAGVTRLHLGQALLKGKKMDFVIQKATELGIDTLHPFTSQFCDISAPAENKISRWQRIVIEACKQCGQPFPPDVRPPVTFDRILTTQGHFDCKLIFREGEDVCPLADCFPLRAPTRSVIMLIGPEGGFSRDEIDKAVAVGYIPVTLGSRVLRAETASIAGMAIVQYLLENLSAKNTAVTTR